ncbi:MAG: CYTH domain-containing protein [Acidobacteria bacterium]|nr:CYTH domain-containing protein [Acidobacteriota bacterium]
MLNIPNPGYEIEIRGLLNADDRARVERLLESEGATLVGDHERESYVFELQDGGLDLRVRMAEKGAELVLKCGPERLATVRWKHTIRLHQEVSLKEALEFVSHYGFTRGRLVRRRYKTYAYRGRYKVVLATVPGAPAFDYFEIEASTVDSAATDGLVVEVEDVARELRLDAFSQDEYRTYLTALDATGIEPMYQYDNPRRPES